METRTIPLSTLGDDEPDRGPGTGNRTIRITWVTRFTGDASGLGLDETIRTTWTDVECYDAAVYRGACEGVDLARHKPIIEVIEAD